MIAARFRLVGWVAGCAGAALCCYLASQSVAAERSALARVDSEIVDTRGDIDKLTTEITTRSRAGQVERWNGVLALQAARPAQYVSTGIQLASLAGGQRLPLDPAIVASHGAIGTVSYQPAPVAAGVPAPVLAAMPAPIAPAAAHEPLLRTASYVHAKPSRLDDADAPALVHVALEKPVAAKAPKLKIAKAEPKPSLGLLPDDLGKLIAAERKSKPAKTGA